MANLPGNPGFWRVLKFGGTSVSSRARWGSIEQVVKRHLAEDARVLVVCSAVAGVTNLLETLVRAARAGEPTAPVIDQILERHLELGRELGLDVEPLIADELACIADFAAGDLDERAEAEVMARGELMSTAIGAEWLARREIRCAWVDARELLEAETGEDRSERFLSAACNGDPDPAMVQRLAETGAPIVITQGYIARSPEGDTVLLGRGGSDTSAAYLASKLSADRLEIWTDVPGLFTANPGVTPAARLLERVGYREAQALGALGAAVLHPRALEVVWHHGVPIEIGWTERPEFHGTIISGARSTDGIKAITARDNLVMFSLRRPPSWQPIGFMLEVAQCFYDRGLSMDLVTSSCSEIRVTLDLDAFPSAVDEIPAIATELEEHCIVRVIQPVASVSVVGERINQTLFDSEDIFGLLSGEVVYMIVHAANEHHVTIVLDKGAADQLVNTAHHRLIENAGDRHDLGPSWAELLADESAGERHAS